MMTDLSQHAFPVRFPRSNPSLQPAPSTPTTNRRWSKYVERDNEDTISPQTPSKSTLLSWQQRTYHLFSCNNIRPSNGLYTGASLHTPSPVMLPVASHTLTHHVPVNYRTAQAGSSQPESGAKTVWSFIRDFTGIIGTLY